MFTIYYNGMYINGGCDKQIYYVTDDYGTYKGIRFKSFRSAQIAITKARKKVLEQVAINPYFVGKYPVTPLMRFTIPERIRGITHKGD
jgi:hypothetical protein